ncbi:primosomal protein N' [Moraxella nasovis]|uniref:primosomal protein N' n=1 Tax=Moraxella nasovis TaxID=2904121 RepID=UPI001F609EB4|nr:primosomal protein N' [Moraxella nasovis]UNU74272.1 primosomal protein N' [Moraxella nasovis]
MLLRLALPVPLYQLFDYLCPNDYLKDGALPKIGVRVLAPFGRQKLVGIILAHIPLHQAQVSHDKLKPIINVLDDTPIIHDKLLTLAHWLSSYYHHPLGDTFNVMLPTLINQGENIDRPITFWQISKAALSDDFINAHLSKTAKKQREQFNIIAQFNQAQEESHLLSLGITRPTLNALYRKNLIERQECKKAIIKPKPAQVINTPLTPTAEQKHAIDSIIKSVTDKAYQGFLLNGITGSGKTEVYLQAMAYVLSLDKQVLVLVPEIGLTPQTKARFSSRFDANICVLHSGMNDTERLQGWQDCRNGTAQIIIGTRSSILYPFDNLGLIVIDEAHDSSYKQQDHLRYHACDVAIWRGYRNNIPVVLGTATPSLEQIKLVYDGKLTELTLTHRAANAKIAQMELVDMRLGTRYATHTDGRTHDTTLSQKVVYHIHEHLERGEQVMVFINQRGYAPILLCDACGWQADCPRCDAHLTLHKYNNKRIDHLKCHHCGYQTALPCACPECHSQNLDSIGTGTTKLTEHLHALFGNPQTNKRTYPIVQIDRDTMRKKGAWEQMHAHILTGEPMILVGTQMIAKGHHFPSVTLVVIANADVGFLSPDFRSPEHTAQRIIQVAGRAGRAGRAGKVLIQTRQPDNPMLTLLAQQGYKAFAKSLLDERRMLSLPPFSHAALVRAESHNLDTARLAITQIGQTLSPFKAITFISTDAPMTKKNGRYHVQLLIIAKDRASLHGLLNTYWQHIISLPTSKAVKLTLDIDPMAW